MNATNRNRLLVTGAVLLLAALVVLVQYWEYVTNPWTRDGQVRAQVIQLTPRVSGPIVALPIVDNQRVKKGDLLFEIDPRTFSAAYDQAQGSLKVAQVDLNNAQSDAELFKEAVAGSPGAVSKIELNQRLDNVLGAEAKVSEAESALESARLDVEFTKVTAPVDGYVTNLNLRLGSQTVVNQPALALIDENSFWVHGYFRETTIADIRIGDHAIVTLMTYPGIPLKGRVESLGWGIAQDDGSTGYNLLPNISPTFEWIRLAQRVPVRIQLDDVPPEVQLRVGSTGSVLVRTGTADDASDAEARAAPQALQ